MGDPLEAAYIAVERAYGEGRFAAALEQALALQPQLQAEHSDQLALRLQLLIGHIHVYGLQQPSQAAAAYGLVLQRSSDATYQALARQGLERCRQQNEVDATPPEAQSASAPDTSAPEPDGSVAELPATPWLSQLSQPERALQEIRDAWSTVVPSQHRSTTARRASGEPQPIEPSGEQPIPAEAASPATSPEAQEQPTSAVNVEDVEDADISAAALPELPGPELPSPERPCVADEPGFSAEEWAEYARGLLLVELSSQPGTVR